MIRIPAWSVRALSLLTAGLAAGCSGGDGAPDEASEASIIGGRAASTYVEAALVTSDVGSCSGAVIAPRVVLTAGHCIVSAQSFRVKAPFAGSSWIPSSGAEVFNYVAVDPSSVNTDTRDVGLVYLASPITLPAYPALATSKEPDGAQAVNVGRIVDGRMSSTELFAGDPVTLRNAHYRAEYYRSERVVERGDSGGPVFRSGTHVIVGVNSGSARDGSSQIIAAVDPLAAWISERIAAHGGAPEAPAPPREPSPAPPREPSPAPPASKDGLVGERNIAVEQASLGDYPSKTSPAAACGASGRGALVVRLVNDPQVPTSTPVVSRDMWCSVTVDVAGGAPSARQEMLRAFVPRGEARDFAAGCREGDERGRVSYAFRCD